MKSIVIDWDFPPKDLDMLFKDLLTPDCKIVLTSACKNVEQIKNELRAKGIYLTDTRLEQNLVIQTSTSLIENTGNNKKALGAKQKEILAAYAPDNLDKDEATFVSTNLHARAEVRLLIENRVSILPQPPVAQPKPADLKPYQGNPLNFAMENAQRLYPSTGNTFASSGEQGVYKVAEKGNSASIWYAKKRDITKLPRVQLEVFASQVYRMLLGDHLPQNQYLVSNDGTNAFVLSKEIEGFTNMNDPQSLDKLEANGFKGVLPSLFLSMFLEENDLRTENMGIDSQGRFVKIDNDAAITTLIFNMRGNAAERYCFGEEDLENPHNPQNFQPTTWQTEIFHNKALKSEENQAELYGLWQKMLQNKQAILQLIEDTIDDPSYKKSLTEKITAKFQRLEQMLDNNPGYKQFLSDQLQAKQQAMKTALTELRQQEPDLTTDTQHAFTS